VRQLADTRLHLERAGASIERLSEAEGISGFNQRSDKFDLQNAQLARGAAAPAFSGGAGGFGAATAPAPGMQAGLRVAPAAKTASSGTAPRLENASASGGYGGLAAGRAANEFRAIDSDQTIVAESVQNAGKETLYRRGRTWVANNAKDVDPEKDKAKIQEVKRFSEEYFALVRANTTDENAVLAAQQEGEELLVKFRGQAYLVK
jgi:hypothetical protein